jgi:excinuclease ABC subunit C
LQYYIKRCLGPCVEGLTTPEIYREAVRDAQMFLEGRQTELARSVEERMEAAAAAQQFELAAKYRDLLVTMSQVQERQRMATTDSDDADVFGYHFENDMLAVNLFHMRGGKIVDRREFFWEDLPEFPPEPPADVSMDTSVDAPSESEAATGSATGDFSAPAARGPGDMQAVGSPANREQAFDAPSFFSALLKQIYIDQQYVPRSIYVPVDFLDRGTLAGLLSERVRHKVELLAPQRGEKRSLVDLAGQNAKQSYDQRFRVLKPSMKAIQEALQDVLTLPELPRRIECFDISHIQGAETVASMVVWEDGAMKKSDYRKFQIKTVEGVDDFAAMREVVGRRYRRIQEEGHAMPSLVLIDGGLGQLHAAFDALEQLGITSQPLASIAKREEVIYLYGQENEPVVLDRRSPVLHLVQQIRDESHRFAVTYHRKRREMRDRTSELQEIPGVGAQTRNRLVAHFGSVRGIESASLEALSSVVPAKLAASIYSHFHPQPLVTIQPATRPQ